MNLTIIFGRMLCLLSSRKWQIYTAQKTSLNHLKTALLIYPTCFYVGKNDSIIIFRIPIAVHRMNTDSTEAGKDNASFAHR